MAQTAAGAGVPSPGNFGGAGLGGVSGSGVPAGAPISGPLWAWAVAA